MKSILAIPALCLALNATASCPTQKPGDLPAIPDGAVATDSEMHKAQLRVENFMLQAEIYLECDSIEPEQQRLLLNQLERFNESYNDALIEFQMRKNMVAGS